MKVCKLIGDYLGENTYLIEKTGSILVIDPGTSSEKLFSAAQQLNGKIVAALLTHGHADHAIGAAGLSKAGVPVYLLKEEEPLLNGRASLALALGARMEKTENLRFLKDGETLSIGPFSVFVIATPGHTAGGACYLIDGALFSGDTLFRFSYGRTDFPTGDEMDLINSIANELFSLPNETVVYCGHSDRYIASGNDLIAAFPDTTIGEEKEKNPILELL